MKTNAFATFWEKIINDERRIEVPINGILIFKHLEFDKDSVKGRKVFVYLPRYNFEYFFKQIARDKICAVENSNLHHRLSFS